MIHKYYVNTSAQPTGEHELHREGCPYLVLINEAIFLGEFSSCADALVVAQRLYSNVDGCYHCCRECHTK